MWERSPRCMSCCHVDAAYGRNGARQRSRAGISHAQTAARFCCRWRGRPTCMRKAASLQLRSRRCEGRSGAAHRLSAPLPKDTSCRSPRGRSGCNRMPRRTASDRRATSARARGGQHIDAEVRRPSVPVFCLQARRRGHDIRECCRGCMRCGRRAGDQPDGAEAAAVMVVNPPSPATHRLAKHLPALRRRVLFTQRTATEDMAHGNRRLALHARMHLRARETETSVRLEDCSAFKGAHERRMQPSPL
eukprot:221475-Chlamydomonas_euryale.AAC.11